MKHSIRFHVVDPIVGKRVKTETVIGELGSGVFDKNGKEIFEGDRVRFAKEEAEDDEPERWTYGVVAFREGIFWVDHTLGMRECASVLGHSYDFAEVEIIGHVGD